MFYNSPEGSHSDSLVDLIVHQKGATASICEKGTAGLTSLSDICASLKQKIEALQPVEKFLMDAVECLPEDYISKSHDPLRSLMLRYQSLIDARKHLLKEWEEKQIRLEEELLQSTTASRNQKQVVIEKVANVHDVLDEADGLRDRIHHFDKTIDREKTCITLQLNEFNLMSRSIRNITAKCVNMLKDLEYHQPLPAPPEKTRLCDCLQLIEYVNSSKVLSAIPGFAF
ncbi:hypothetical protein EGR_06678 [Echinococcus granulosus]|uniref:Uncharacterized protein n=1 Tax=Echinococcus granulosus TaxID=6210 RepID=W6UK66_ECHGR|nr:hypothetical protein EGR_06678 [Echinococcus granulosus]EUB58497.1 hypothetical protein EGR_06678 [Echinococcus granulosus]